MVSNDGDNTFTKIVIDAQTDGAYFAVMADIDDDGDQDVVSASQNDDRVALFLNDGAQNFTKTIVDDSANGARAVFVEDVDADGDLDLLSSSVDDDTIAWYAQDDAGGFAEQRIAEVAGAYGVYAFDVDFDGIMDVLSAGRDDGSINIHRQTKLHRLNVEAETSIAIDADVLWALDADSPDIALSYTLLTAPALRDVTLNGVALIEGEAFTQRDVLLGLVAYEHRVVEETADGFSFNLSDGASPQTRASGAFEITITPAAAETP